MLKLEYKHIPDDIDYDKIATSKSPKERDKNNDSLDIDSIINEI